MIFFLRDCQQLQLGTLGPGCVLTVVVEEIHQPSHLVLVAGSMVRRYCYCACACFLYIWHRTCLVVREQDDVIQQLKSVQIPQLK